MVHSYFSQLFQSEDYEVNEAVLNAVKLLFSYEEVKHALFSIGDLKAPGPDGLRAFFFL